MQCSVRVCKQAGTSSGRQEGFFCGADSEAETGGLRTGMGEGFRLGEAVFQEERMACLKAVRSFVHWKKTGGPPV